MYHYHIQIESRSTTGRCNKSKPCQLTLSRPSSTLYSTFMVSSRPLDTSRQMLPTASPGLLQKQEEQSLRNIARVRLLFLELDVMVLATDFLMCFLPWHRNTVHCEILLDGNSNGRKDDSEDGGVCILCKTKPSNTTVLPFVNQPAGQKQ